MTSINTFLLLAAFSLVLASCALGPDVTLLEVVASADQKKTEQVNQAQMAQGGEPVTGLQEQVSLAASDGTTGEEQLGDAPLALLSAEAEADTPGMKVLRDVEGGSLESQVSPNSGIITSAAGQKEATIAYMKALGLANAASWTPITTFSANDLRLLAANEQEEALAAIEGSKKAADAP